MKSNVIQISYDLHVCSYKSDIFRIFKMFNGTVSIKIGHVNDTVGSVYYSHR